MLIVLLTEVNLRVNENGKEKAAESTVIVKPWGLNALGVGLKFTVVSSDDDGITTVGTAVCFSFLYSFSIPVILGIAL